MLPTIDLSNFVKKIVMAVGWVYVNPIGRTIAFATVCTVAWTTFVGLQDYFNPPQLDVESFLETHSNDFVLLVFYCLSLDTLFDILNCLFVFCYWFVSTSLVVTVSMIVGMWIFHSKGVIATAYYQLAH